MTDLNSALKHELVDITAGNISIQQLSRWLGEHSVQLMETGNILDREVIGELENSLAEPEPNMDDIMSISRLILAKLYAPQVEVTVSAGTGTGTLGDPFAAGVPTSTTTPTTYPTPA